MHTVEMTAPQKKHTIEFVRIRDIILTFVRVIRVREIKEEKEEQRFFGSVTLENVYAVTENDAANWQAKVIVTTKLSNG